MGTTKRSPKIIADTYAARYANFYDGLAAFRAEHFAKAVDRIVADLRQAADEIERSQTRKVRPDNRHVDVATSIVHTVHSMLPNLPLGNLIDAAHEADQAEAQARALRGEDD